ncbi:glycosyltransferase [Nitrosopumilus sp.]|uniref:glycosyltransferase n=1 Tax=Nitrosopumilus sp. TaxID=2024843 RepID=UPI00247B7A1E|nr:glycosyltransferase [Nitrosopumilus sp.]MCV0430372.1 glycosyltransferase [Nitrosopumilus sp.]
MEKISMNKKLCIFPSDPIIDYYNKGEIKERYFNPKNIFDEIDIISLADIEIEEEKVKKLVGTAKLKIHAIGKSSNRNRNQDLSKILQLVKELKPDVIRSYNSLLSGWYAASCAKELKIPFFLSLHTQYDHMRKIAKKESIKKFLALKYTEKKIEPFVLENADKITIVYQIIESYVKKHTIKKPEVLYNKIDFERFSSGKKINDISTPMIISVGRLIEPKNHQCLIHAMKNVNANLLIIGDGALYDKLTKLIEKLDLKQKISIMRSVPNEKIQDYYKSAEIFALAYDTKLEGIPIPIIESMASGLPVLIPYSENNSAGELGDAVMYSENNPKSFSENINKLLHESEQREKMSQKGIKKAMEFDSNIIEKRESEIYLELMSK